MSIFKSSWIQDLASQVVSGGLSRAVRSAQLFLEEAIHHVLDEAATSFRKVFVLYAALAGLALVAIIALGTAFSEGLVALGLPAWASHLILATVAGLVAAAVYLRAGQSPTQPEGAEADETGSSGSGSRGFTIKVVHVHPPNGAQGKASRRRVIEVRPAGNGWEVTSGRSPRKHRPFATKRGAVRAAMAAARRESAEVVIAAEGPRKHPFQGVA